ncbi:MAG: S9 family peptidase, partial [Ignavibacteriaceae bacterium]
MKKFFLLLFFITIIVFPQQKRAISVDDLWAMKRIGSYDISPDGKTIAFAITSYTFEENKGNTDIYLINSDGSNLRPFKRSDKNETEPKFSPDGKQIAYTMGGHIYVAGLDGKGDKQLTNIYTGASGFKWSNDGKKILFVSSVYPDCKTQQCNEEIDKAREESKVKAKIFDRLMYRHWNDWRGDKRSHLFLLDIESGTITDLTEGNKEDVPPLSLGSSNDYNFSPDDTEIAFTMNPEFSTAISTNNEMYLLSLTEPSSPKLISSSKGVDCQPVYSPDGRYLAWTSMQRAGFEADKKDIVLFERTSGTIRNITEDTDLSVDEFIWSPTSMEIYFNADNEIYKSIYKLDIESGDVELFHKENYNTSISIS